jgi:hypothetical protein
VLEGKEMRVHKKTNKKISRGQKRPLELIVEEVDCEDTPRSYHLSKMSSPKGTSWKTKHHPLTAHI